MKTADDWDKFFSERYDARKHPEWKIKSDLEMFSDMCNHIQLDAFKAGAEWAARIIHVRELFSAGIPVDSKQVTRGEREILSALLALKEIPK